MTLQRSFIFLKLGLIFSISYILADITGLTIATKFKKSFQKTKQNSKPPFLQTSTIKHNLDYYSVIYKKNIFYKKKIPEVVVSEEKESLYKQEDPQVESQAENVAIAQIPVSPLNFKLVGIATRGGKGYIAFLENKTTRKQKSYKIGDTLLSNVEIVAIKKKSVVVKRNEKLEVIEYPTKKKKKQRVSLNKRNTKKGPRGLAPPPSNTQTLDKRYIDNELKNMGRLMTQIRAVPVKNEGFKVFNIAKGSLFQKIGLENGDLINRINGIELTSPDKAMGMYMQLKGSREIHIDFTRNGTQISQSFFIR